MPAFAIAGQAEQFLLFAFFNSVESGKPFNASEANSAPAMGHLGKP